MNSIGTDAGAATKPGLLHPSERPWSHTRQWFCIALILGAQIGLIFALGDRKAMVPRQPARVPELRLAESVGEALELDNPTLFALPSPEGFSGQAWQQLPDVDFHPFESSEPARWLDLPSGQLGTVLSQFIETNLLHTSAFATKLAPTLNLPKSELADAATDASSSMRVEGDLAKRRLLYPPDLPAWPGTDLLSDTVVQVLVDSQGRVITTALVPPGTRDADQWALNLAKALEFSPLPKNAASTPRWTVGSLVFHWQTVPLPATNAPAVLP